MAGKKISPHKLRSTCAVNIYEQTGDIYLAKEVLGHKNVANTQRYAMASAKKKRNAANILDNL
jgi:site-specific recombinase XerC